MTEKCGLHKTRELKDEKYKTTDDIDEEKIKNDEQCTNNSKGNLLLVKKWTQIDNETTLKPPYIWIPSRAPNDSESEPMKRRKPKQKGKGDLLFMLASMPEKCQSFVQQTQLIKRNADESEKSEQETRSGEDKAMPETACVPRWMISCHISNQALKSRLLPLAGAQIRRRIRQGSLVLCPNITSLASDRLSPRRPTNNEVLLTSLPDISTANDGCCQQNSIAQEFTFPKQKMIYLNDTLKSKNVNLEQHQHTTPHFIDELFKTQYSEGNKRRDTGIPLLEQEESKAKTHRLNDLMLFEKSKQTEVKQTAYHINSVDSIQDLCMNRCYTSPINWPPLSHNNLGLKETGCNVSEVILPLFNETKNYRDDVGGSKHLVENDDLRRQSDSAVEESSNSVAIWKTMPGRLLRRAKTQHLQSNSEKSRNDKALTNISRQKDDTSTLDFLIENVNNINNEAKSFPSDKSSQLNENNSDSVQAEHNDSSNCNFNSSYWSSRRHPGYIERMHTICSVSNSKSRINDNKHNNISTSNRNPLSVDNYNNFNSPNTISLEPRTKSFLPQLRQSQSTGKYGNRQMLKHHLQENNQISSFTSLPVLIKPPPPSPDIKFSEFS
ncbi:unnamed protein product [Trichobilharzia szidati]|nr:unnamed protein product [Trichobilharzia szidati]